MATKKKVGKKTTKKTSKKTTKKTIKKKPVKKKVSKKTTKKSPVKSSKKNSQRLVQTRRIRATKRKIHVTSGNLIFFFMLFIASFLLYTVSTKEIYVNLFQVLSMILGAISLALLIVLVTLMFMRYFRK